VIDNSGSRSDTTGSSENSEAILLHGDKLQSPPGSSVIPRMILSPPLSCLSRRLLRAVDPVWADVLSVGLDQPLGPRCRPVG
jgi:hypothetical protein